MSLIPKMIVCVNTEEEAECGVLFYHESMYWEKTELIFILKFQIMHFEKRQLGLED